MKTFIQIRCCITFFYNIVRFKHRREYLNILVQKGSSLLLQLGDVARGNGRGDRSWEESKKRKERRKKKKKETEGAIIESETVTVYGAISQQVRMEIENKSAKLVLFVNYRRGTGCGTSPDLKTATMLS